MFGWLFGADHTDEELRRLTLESPGGNECQVLTNEDNAGKWYESEDYTVTRDESYTYHEPGLLSRLFGRS